MSTPEDDAFAKTQLRNPTPAGHGNVPTLSAPLDPVAAPSANGTGAPDAAAAPAAPAVAWKDEAHNDPLIGKQLGDFIIRQRLGQGGMGLVYSGEQPLIGKKVAIKVLRPEIARDPEQVQRLLAEARAVNAIRHRGIIDIFNFGELPDGRHYVVMEYLAGRALDELIAKRGALPPVEALELLDEVLAALGAGHEAGIIHRDLKPSNIFLVSQPDGSTYVKLLDFGLAKQSAAPRGATPQTRTDMFVGTPEYVAPEQARAEVVGPYTDLYAAGVVAFEMLTGRLPFEASSPIEWVIKHLEVAPPKPSDFTGGIPVELDALVLRMLEKDAKKRPESAERIRREIARIRKGLATQATQIAGVPMPLAPQPAPVQAKRPAGAAGPGAAPAAAPRAPGAAPAVRPNSEATRAEATTLDGEALAIRKSKVPFVVAGVAGLALVIGLVAFAVTRGDEGPTPTPVENVTPRATTADPVKAATPEQPATPTKAAPAEIAKPTPAAPVEAPAEAPKKPEADAAATANASPPEPVKKITPTRPVEVKPASSSRSSRASRDDVPSRRELLKEIERLEKRVRDQAHGEAPPEPVLAFLTQYRSEAKSAASVDDRKELARKLQKFEVRFLNRR